MKEPLNNGQMAPIQPREVKLIRVKRHENIDWNIHDDWIDRLIYHLNLYLKNPRPKSEAHRLFAVNLLKEAEKINNTYNENKNEAVKADSITKKLKPLIVSRHRKNVRPAGFWNGKRSYLDALCEHSLNALQDKQDYTKAIIKLESTYSDKTKELNEKEKKMLSKNSVLEREKQTSEEKLAITLNKLTEVERTSSNQHEELGRLRAENLYLKNEQKKANHENTDLSKELEEAKNNNKQKDEKIRALEEHVKDKTKLVFEEQIEKARLALEAKSKETHAPEEKTEIPIEPPAINTKNPSTPVVPVKVTRKNSRSLKTYENLREESPTISTTQQVADNSVTQSPTSRNSTEKSQDSEDKVEDKKLKPDITIIEQLVELQDKLKKKDEEREQIKLEYDRTIVKYNKLENKYEEFQKVFLGVKTQLTFLKDCYKRMTAIIDKLFDTKLLDGTPNTFPAEFEKVKITPTQEDLIKTIIAAKPEQVTDQFKTKIAEDAEKIKSGKPVITGTFTFLSSVNTADLMNATMNSTTNLLNVAKSYVSSPKK